MTKWSVVNLAWVQLLCAVVLVGSVSSQQQTAGQETHPEVNKRPSVQVFLTAVEQNGSPAVLAPSKLSVLVDKQPAQVTTLRSAKADDLLFALLVDISKSDAGPSGLVKRAALQLFQGLSSDGNRGYLVLFNHSVAISKQPLQVSQVQALLDTVKFDGGTAVYDAIEQTCLQTLSRSRNPDNPRRAIVLISDGEDNSSHVNHLKAEEAAEKEGITVFSLAPRSSLAGQQGGRFLKEISHSTGGQAIIGMNLPDGVAPIFSAIETQWAMTLVPAQSGDQRLHSLNVKTSDKTVHISAPSRVLLQ